MDICASLLTLLMSHMSCSLHCVKFSGGKVMFTCYHDNIIKIMISRNYDNVVMTILSYYLDNVITLSWYHYLVVMITLSCYHETCWQRFCVCLCNVVHVIMLSWHYHLSWQSYHANVILFIKITLPCYRDNRLSIFSWNFRHTWRRIFECTLC
jgi:hypothetical protein